MSTLQNTVFKSTLSSGYDIWSRKYQKRFGPGREIVPGTVHALRLGEKAAKGRLHRAEVSAHNLLTRVKGGWGGNLATLLLGPPLCSV